jgi:ubiquinone biosynthesis protein COQ4
MALYDPSEIRVGDAIRALRALLQDPDDTAQAFRVVDALSGRNGERTLARLRRSKSGKELLRDRPELLPRLTDRAALLALPEGTLGREYLRFLDSEGITAAGLTEASIEGRRSMKPEVDPDLYFLRDRLRDTHDLWHTVTGYKGDLLGEASLLAFSFAQTWNLGVGLIVVAALVQGRDPAVRKLVATGFARGLRSAWLPAVRWENLLDRPLAEVRRTLNVGAPVVYEPLRTSALRAEAA